MHKTALCEFLEELDLSYEVTKKWNFLGKISEAEISIFQDPKIVNKDVLNGIYKGIDSNKHGIVWEKFDQTNQDRFLFMVRYLQEQRNELGFLVSRIYLRLLLLEDAPVVQFFHPMLFQTTLNLLRSWAVSHIGTNKFYLFSDSHCLVKQTKKGKKKKEKTPDKSETEQGSDGEREKTGDNLELEKQKVLKKFHLDHLDYFFRFLMFLWMP
jgi:hypothetical protein